MSAALSWPVPGKQRSGRNTFDLAVKFRHIHHTWRAVFVPNQFLPFRMNGRGYDGHSALLAVGRAQLYQHGAVKRVLVLLDAAGHGTLARVPPVRARFAGTAMNELRGWQEVWSHRYGLRRVQVYVQGVAPQDVANVPLALEAVIIILARVPALAVAAGVLGTRWKRQWAPSTGTVVARPLLAFARLVVSISPRLGRCVLRHVLSHLHQ